jgi:hypothetical protein
MMNTQQCDAMTTEHAPLPPPPYSPAALRGVWTGCPAGAVSELEALPDIGPFCGLIVAPADREEVQ